jgi:hypothetical protein
MSKSADDRDLEELILETERNRTEIELSLEKAKKLKAAFDSIKVVQNNSGQEAGNTTSSPIAHVI